MSEAKRGNLFIVGQEGVGKTSMVKNIMGEAWTSSAIRHKDVKDNISSPIESERFKATDGVDRHQWILPADEEAPITITLHDFPSQAIYQETPSLLLNSGDSIVVLMFNITMSLHESRLAHWIYTLSSRAPGALLFIVASHIDKLKEKDVEKTLDSIQRQLEGLYYDINASIAVTNRLNVVPPSKEQQGRKSYIFWTMNNLKCNQSSKPALFLQIEQSIREHILSREVPQLFIDLHNRLEEEYQQMAKDAMPIIRSGRLEEIANEVGFANKEMIKQALQVISGWRNILIFSDDIFQSNKESELNVAVLLNPNWLINAFKSIVSVRNLQQGIYSTVTKWLKRKVQPDTTHKLAQVSKSDIALRLREFEPNDENVSEEEITSVVNMLQSMGMIIPMHIHLQEEFFVPSMLYGIQPGKLKLQKKPIEIIRSYSLRFWPSGQFFRFMVCVVRCFGSMNDIVSAWDGGFVMVPSCSPENEIRIFTETKAGIGNTIHLHVLGDSFEANYQSLGKLMETLHQKMMFLLDDMEHGTLEIYCSYACTGNQDVSGTLGAFLVQPLSQKPLLSHEHLKYIVPEIYLTLGSKFYELPSLLELSDVNSENYETFSPHEIKSNQLGNIVTLKRLGQGVQGFVDLGEVKTSSLHATETVAIKFPHPDKLDAIEIENLLKVISLMRLLKHRNLVRLLDVVIQPLPGLPLAIIAAFCPGGDLDVVPGKERIFDVLVVMRIARDVAAALGYLHSRNPPVLHLDVSGRNVYLVEARVDARVCAVLGGMECAQSVCHETKRVGNWSIGNDVFMYHSFLKQLMTVSVSQDQREHPTFLQLDQLCQKMGKDPDAFQFTQVASSLDKYLSKNCLEEAEEEPKICFELTKLIEEYGGVEKMDKLDMEKMIELLAPEDIVLIKDGESSQWKSVCKIIYPVAVRAVRENLTELIDALVRVGFVDVGNDEDDGNSLLHIAAICGHHEIMHHILSGWHVDVNIPNRHKNYRALHFAASFGKIECISLLLDYWAIIDATDSRGQTALFKAAEEGHAEAVQLLALRGANVNIVVECDTGNIVPIIAAARLGHRQCVTELLRFGANVSSIQQININVAVSETKLIQECARLVLESSKASLSPVRQQSITKWLN